MSISTKKGLQIRSITILWFFCCLICCISGDSWAGPLISVCQYLMFGFLLFLLLCQGIPVRRELAFFCVAIIIISLLCAVYNTFSDFYDFDLFLHLRQTIYFLLFLYSGYYIACENKKGNLIFKTIHYISMIAAGMIILQFLAHWMGLYLNRIPVLGDFLFQAVDNARYFRPSAFFSEPSYFAEICLIDVYYYLFKKKNIKILFFEVLAIVLSTSSMGIVFAYSLFVIWACTQKLVKNPVVNTLIKVGIILSLIIAIVIFIGYQGDNAIIHRIQGGATINQRTLRAFEIFGNLDFGHQLFGIGMQNLSIYLNAYAMNLEYDGVDTLVNKEFAQSFGYILCTLGIPGAIAFVGYWISLFCQCSKENRFFFLLVAELCLTSSLITRLIFAIYVAVAYLLLFEKQKIQDELNDE